MVRAFSSVFAAALLLSGAVARPLAVPVARDGHVARTNNYDQNNQYGNDYGNNNYNQGNDYGNKSNDYNKGSDYNKGNDYGNKGNNYGDKNNQYKPPSDETSTKEYEATSTTEEYKATSTTEEYKATSTTMAEETSTTMEEATSTTMEYEATSTSMAEETSTTMEEATSTTYDSQPTATYGSGSYNPDYDSCVQQCQNKYGSMKTATEEPTKTQNPPSGNGMTHTITVAPTLGVLRYVPFAMNASVGDTVIFKWGAGPHTVTKSSELTPCNKTLDGTAFTSGPQNKSFEFTQVVNDTNPVYYYCGVAPHCQKGMFGILNPPNAAGTGNNVGALMSSMVQQNPGLQPMWTYTKNLITGTPAEKWGDELDVMSIPEASRVAFIENVMYTKALYALNPSMLEAGGTSSPDGSPIKLPANMPSAVDNTASTPYGGGYGNTTPQSNTPGSSDTTAANQTGSPNGAGRIVSSGAFVAVAAIATTFFAL